MFEPMLYMLLDGMAVDALERAELDELVVAGREKLLSVLGT